MLAHLGGEGRWLLGAFVARVQFGVNYLERERERERGGERGWERERERGRERERTTGSSVVRCELPVVRCELL